MDVLCELYPVEMTAIFASKRIFAAAATGGARTAELPAFPGSKNHIVHYQGIQSVLSECCRLVEKYVTE